MKKQMIRVLTMFGFLMSLTAATAFAQTKPAVKVNIPFQFSVANRTLPAGEYTLTERSGAGQAVIVRNNENHAVVFAMTRSASVKEEANKPMLVFRRYGNQYFLAQVVGGGGTDAQELIQTRAERQAIKDMSNRNLAQADAKPELVTIAAIR